MLLLASCGKDSGNCIRSAGKEAEQTATFGPEVCSLFVDDEFEITLIQDSLYFAEITFGENLIDNVRIEQEGETLRVTNDNICNWTRPKNDAPKVVLHVGALRHIYSKTAGTISCEKLVSDTLALESLDASGTIQLHLQCNDLSVAHHSGITDFILSGTADVAYYYTSSSSDLQARDLECRTLSVNNNGFGDMHVRATETLYYQIYDVGDIYLSGTASPVKWVDQGDGQLFLR